MRNRYGRLAAIARMTAAVAVTLAIATPASAQFGGLKKKLKGAAAQEGASKAAGAAGVTPEAAAGATEAGGGGGTVVLTEDVVARLLTGLKAGQAARAAALKEDTPYGRYKKAEAALVQRAGRQDGGRPGQGEPAARRRLPGLGDGHAGSELRGEAARPAREVL